MEVERNGRRRRWEKKESSTRREFELKLQVGAPPQAGIERLQSYSLRYRELPVTCSIAPLSACFAGTRSVVFSCL